ncbi:uncharacterized protein LOC121037328 [Herpailurus yagouaroundi]|uniref:uncharacterized protein LOC121037328 n=1 Tax=Herpailurus yagouaroundi TaxID=1608482 RepID=UPI001AD71EF1|nr:uncharacterized protein LOC121037328 [Puma yagouaroundi]
MALVPYPTLAEKCVLKRNHLLSRVYPPLAPDLRFRRKKAKMGKPTLKGGRTRSPTDPATSPLPAAARSSRAAPPPGGERPAQRRRSAGGWDPSAVPRLAAPPSPPRVRLPSGRGGQRRLPDGRCLDVAAEDTGPFSEEDPHWQYSSKGMLSRVQKNNSTIHGIQKALHCFFKSTEDESIKALYPARSGKSPCHRTVQGTASCTVHHHHHCRPRQHMAGMVWKRLGFQGHQVGIQTLDLTNSVFLSTYSASPT